MRETNSLDTIFLDIAGEENDSGDSDSDGDMDEDEDSKS